MGATAWFKVLTDQELSCVISHPDEVEDLLFPEDVDDPFEGQVTLYKSWHELHFILTGTLEPDGSLVGDAILGGEEIGRRQGMDYGRPRLISAPRVRAISDAISELDFATLFRNVGRLSPLLSEVYSGAGIFQERENLEQSFYKLVNVYRTAAFEQRAMIAYLA